MAGRHKRTLPRTLGKTFRLAFGDDERVIFWLIGLGGIFSVGSLLLIVALMLSLADAPPSSASEVVLGVLEGLGETPAIWFLLIGIGALTVRRRWAMPRAERVGPRTLERKPGFFAVLFGNDYRVAIWIIVLGAIWAADLALEVAPSFLETGKPPGYGWIGPPHRLPPVEHIVKDALVPMVSYVMTHSLGGWLIGAGAVICVVQLGRKLARCD